MGEGWVGVRPLNPGDKLAGGAGAKAGFPGPARLHPHPRPFPSLPSGGPGGPDPGEGEGGDQMYRRSDRASSVGPVFFLPDCGCW